MLKPVPAVALVRSVVLVVRDMKTYKRKILSALNSVVGRLGNKQAVKPSLTTTGTFHIVTDL